MVKDAEFTEEDLRAMMAVIGRIGGSVRSERKRKATRKNLEKARRAKERLRSDKFEPDDD